MSPHFIGSANNAPVALWSGLLEWGITLVVAHLIIRAFARMFYHRPPPALPVTSAALVAVLLAAVQSVRGSDTVSVTAFGAETFVLVAALLLAERWWWPAGQDGESPKR